MASRPLMGSWVAKPVVTSRIREGAQTMCRSTQYAIREDKSRQAYVDPKFREKAFRGLPKLLMPYSSSTYRETQKFANYRDNFGNPYSFCAIRPCNQGWQWEPSGQFKLEVAERASNIFHGKLGDRDSFNAAVSIAELGQTVGLVASTAARLNTSISALRKGNVTQAFRTLGIADSRKIQGLRGVPNRLSKKRHGNTRAKEKALTARDHRLDLINETPLDGEQLADFAARSWLELQYGWTPLLNDVYGAAEFAAQLLVESPADFVVKATFRDTLIRETSDLKPYSGLVTKASSTFALRHKYIAYLKIGDPEVRLHASLGLSNPALVVWEKVPFSFVADWFLPVGAFLDNLDSLRGYDVVQACHSVKEEYYNTYTYLPNRVPSYTYYGTATGKVLSSKFTRNAGKQYVPDVALPSFQLDLDWANAATAVSLLKVLTS